jgi:hypothetical protein
MTWFKKSGKGFNEGKEANGTVTLGSGESEQKGRETRPFGEKQSVIRAYFSLLAEETSSLNSMSTSTSFTESSHNSI